MTSRFSAKLKEGVIRMQKDRELQDLFLNQARKEKLAVTVFLVNGFQIRGLVTGFDNFTVVIMSEGKQQMIYKHAISTIVPARPLSLTAEET
jgi:host factor-I protein